MRALSSVKWLRSLRATGAAGILFLAACYGGNNAVSPSDLAAGKAQVKIELVPTGTDCIVITIVGPTPPGTTVTDPFDVTAQSSSTFSLVNLPIGSDTFSASSYSVPCSQRSGAVATYVSLSQSATLGGPVPTVIDLQMGTSGEATVGVDFPTPADSIAEYSLVNPEGPQGITAGPDGALWFTESNNDNIGRVTVGGTISEFSDVGILTGANSIATGSDGKLWYTLVFTGSGGNVEIGTMTPGGVVGGEYTTPTADSAPANIVAGPDGNLWFAETAVGKVGRIAISGAIAANDEFNIAGSAAPQGIAFGSDGNLWIVDGSADTIYVMSISGAVLHTFSIGTTFGTSGDQLRGIVAGADGNLWFTEFGSNKIGVISTSGVLLNEFTVPTVGSEPLGITAGPDGNVWFTEKVGNNIGRVATGLDGAPLGTITEFPIPTAGSEPMGITAGPDGNVWFTEYSASKIGKLSVF